LQKKHIFDKLTSTILIALSCVVGAYILANTIQDKPKYPLKTEIDKLTSKGYYISTKDGFGAVFPSKTEVTIREANSQTAHAISYQATSPSADCPALYSVTVTYIDPSLSGSTLWSSEDAKDIVVESIYSFAASINGDKATITTKPINFPQSQAAIEYSFWWTLEGERVFYQGQFICVNNVLYRVSMSTKKECAKSHEADYLIFKSTFCIVSMNTNTNKSTKTNPGK
jgi:hypothetical protein